ncbi:Oidioi.mRNA.OKI2018_I69.chr1.g3056.t1.cds [Oikopleura dioica]|uniref:Oidioi.mRNA.OKI2018_I69.chr1.g3056.t1.cds n=1 Tax=Oikopleura dioica TaxID=34765 RepID=A0ABN7SSZ3_OIKDI|nr:Oidioi.mRNA.OKI2018_I69.chr1.g3056.t1.cds [Oikopleura dioica]
MSLDSDCKRGRSRRSNSRSVKRSPYRRRSRSRSRSQRSIFIFGIFNLGRDISRNELRKVFERYGRILSCNLVYDREYKESRGFGFVTFENIDDAIYAKKDANEIYIGSGERIRIDYSVDLLDTIHEDTMKEDNLDREADNAILAHEVGDGIHDLEVADDAIDPGVMSDILVEIVTLDRAVEAGKMVEVNIHEIGQ